MAFLSSKLRLPVTSHPLWTFSQLTFKSFSSSSLVSEFDAQDEENDIKSSKHDTKLSPADTLLAEKFHSLIKDHYHKNPNPDPNPAPQVPNLTIATLSHEFT